MINLITSILPIIDKVLSKYIKSKEEKEKIKKEIELELIENQQEIEKLKAEIVKSEIQGKSWLQRNWRPLLMMNFVLILFNNYVLVPYMSIFTDKVKVLEFPEKFWILLIIGVGGYLTGRTFEKKWKVTV
ncbi:MAG: hypothetical protein GXO22_04320 [Aquificae bacterium]|nr:hypothetical protein [Aquificota bacterium]